MLWLPIRNKETPVNLSLAVPVSLIQKALLLDLDNAQQLNVNLNPAIVPKLCSNSLISLEKARRAVVMVYAPPMWGSGILISSDGYILTNAHVVKQALASNLSQGLQPVLKPYCNIQIRYDHPSPKVVSLFLKR